MKKSHLQINIFHKMVLHINRLTVEVSMEVILKMARFSLIGGHLLTV